MKNLFLLPTDKPSRLHTDLREFFLTPKYQIGKEINSIVESRNIYITNDEEIKEGDWYLTSKNTLCKCYETDSKYVYSLEGGSSTNCKKIILTTDQDLIKYGVQAIPDEFLELFVKNPSCEEVEVISERRNWKEINWITVYKIIIPKEVDVLELGQIIPKEEPKQETPKEIAERYYEDEVSINAFINGYKLAQEQFKNK